MPQSAEEVAYQESLRSVSEQNRILEGLRSSSGLLLAANSIGTSFFGNLTIQGGHVGMTHLVAILFFTMSAGCCVSILWPQRGWYSQFSSSRFLGGIEQARPVPTVDDIQRHLALYLEDHLYKNTAILDGLFARFRASAVLLMIEVLAWMAALSGRFDVRV